MTKEKPPYPSDRVVLEEIRLQRANHDSVFESLDRKLATVLGANGIITIISILLSFVQGRTANPKWVLILVPPVVLLLLGFIFSIVAIWPRTWYWNPKPRVLCEDYLKRKPETLKQEEPGTVAQIVADIWSGYEKNENTLKGKVKWLKVSLACEGTGLVLFVAYWIVYILIGG